ncbi:MAG: hypothetical protein WKG01_23075 [Kofleriaceae bacterium]
MRFAILVGVVAVGCGSEPGESGVDAGDADASPDSPAPDAQPISLSPAAIEHGLIRVGQIVRSSITVANPSPGQPAPIDSIVITGTDFTMSTTCGATLPAAGVCAITVDLTPAALTAYDGTITVTSAGMARDIPLSANGAWELNVAQSGSGGGTITSTPSGITCPGRCANLFAGEVELAVEPDTGSWVSAWSDPACSDLRCVVRPALAGRDVTAYFAPGRPISVTVEGSGTVTSSPAGIACGPTCSHVFTGEVMLTATPDVGQAFETWSEITCGTSPTCVIPAGDDPVEITAFFTTGPGASLDLELAGDAAGEIVVYLAGTRVGRCTSSCSLAVPDGTLTIAAATPHRLESLTGTGCVPDGDRCEITPPGYARVTATFRRDPKDRWTFFGNPGETFVRGGFDAAGNLIAGSQQRLIKLGPTGTLVWERPWSGGSFLVGASGDIYLSDPRGTVKLDPAGNEVWVRPGTPSALDPTGNVLVVDSDTGAPRMTLYQPAGTVIWRAPGAGTQIDGTGRIYEPFTTLVESDPPDDHGHLVLAMHRYAADGTPLSDFGSWGGVEESGEFQVAVTAHRLAVLERDAYDFSWLRLSIHEVATYQRTQYVEEERLQPNLMTGFIIGAGDDIGFAHEPGENVMYWFYGYGYQLDRLRADGSTWTVQRIAPPSDAYRADYGPLLGGVAGGPGGELAMLGAYQQFRAWPEPAAPVGLIQAFAP